MLTTAGYDPATGLLLADPPPMPDVPEQPSRADAEAALSVLDGLLEEFPFVNDASRSVALSQLLTPVVRGAMRHAPVHVANAPIAGSGKSTLGNVAAMMATGQPCPVVSIGGNEELEKRLVGAVLAGRPILAIDNVNGVLQSDFLCQIVTQELLELRKLGSTGNYIVKCVATVFVNGNNVEIEGDLVRRSLRCDLDPQMEDPTVREFKGDPEEAVRADRGKFVAAALTLVRAHLVAGCPGAKQVRPLAGFAEWSRLVRSALVWLGRADPVTTQESLRREDPAVVALDLVLEAWAEALTERAFADVPLTVRELVGRNVHKLELELRGATRTRDGEALSVVKVGQFLKRHQGRVRKGAKLVSEFDSHRKQQTWRLVGWRELLGAERPTDQGNDAGKVVALGTRGGSRKAVRKNRPDGF